MLDCNKDTKNTKENTISLLNNDDEIIEINTPKSNRNSKTKNNKNKNDNRASKTKFNLNRTKSFDNAAEHLIKLKSDHLTKSEIIRLNDIRPERPWDDNLEKYAYSELSIKEKEKVLHMKSGKFFNKKFLVWGFLSMLIPIVMSTISMSINETDKEYKYVNSMAFLLTGVIGLIVSFCKFKGKATAHFIFTTQISSFLYEYESELKKPREHRIKASVYQTKLTDNLERLSREEPLLPTHIENNKTNICNHLFC